MGFFGGSSSSSSSSTDASTQTPPDFAPPSSPLSSPSDLNPTTAPTGEIRQRLQQQISASSNLANAQVLIKSVNKNCFRQCVPAPGSSLSGKEQACLSSCMDKYIQAWNAVNVAYVSRLQREQREIPLGNMGM